MDHLRARGCGTVGAKPTTQLQQERGEGPGRAAGKDGAPSPQPTVTGAGLTQERHGLLRPPATHFAGKDHQTGAAVSSRKLEVRDLLPAPRACKGCTIHPRAQWTGLAVPPHSRHQGGVNRELSPMEQRQPVRDHFKSPLILCTPRRQVQVTDSDVEGDPATCFPADASRRTLQS